MHDLYAAWIHEWHWLYQQVQINVWFGNIVAGIVVFIVMDVAWRWKVKGWVNEFVHKHFAHHREIQSEMHDANTQAILDAIESLREKP